MTKKSDTRARRIEHWKAVLCGHGARFPLVPKNPKTHPTVLMAAKLFGLDPSKEPDMATLLYVLADVAFGKRGRPKGSKKRWRRELIQLAQDCYDVKKDMPNLSDTKAMVVIKQRHPQRYRHTSAEMMRQLMRVARFHYDEAWDQKLIDLAGEAQANLDDESLANLEELSDAFVAGKLPVE
jgi:hypothetical protein